MKILRTTVQSPLPVLSKVAERLAHQQFMNYLVAEDKLSVHQNGNWKHSTQTALLNVRDEILQAIDKSKVTVMVLLDMSKAFDSNDHKKLLEKLKHLGTTSYDLAWFSSYISGRRQRVCIGERYLHLYPSPIASHKGLPWGHCCSRSVNDLPSAVQSCKPECYVDDSNLYISFPTNEIDAITF